MWRYYNKNRNIASLILKFRSFKTCNQILQITDKALHKKK